jgi:HK97 family phage major capsid protein
MTKEQLEALGRKIEALENDMNKITNLAVEQTRAFSAEENTKLSTLRSEHTGLVEVMRAAKAAPTTVTTSPASGMTAAVPDAQIAARAAAAEQQHANGGAPKVPAEAKTDFKPFRSFGEQMRAIAIAEKNPHRRDPRLDQVMNWYADNYPEQYRAASGMNEGTPADGGFLVQKDFSDKMITMIYETSKLAKYCTEIPISANSNEIEIPALDETSRATGSRLGGVRVYWGNEGDSPTTSKPKFRTIKMSLLKMFAAGYTTEELQMDAAALGSFLESCFVNELGFEMDDCIIRANGAGRPEGILSSPALVTVTKETSQTAATFNFQNALKMRIRMCARGLSKARFFVNQELWGQIPQMTLLGGTSSPGIFTHDAKVSPDGTLLGHPVEVLEQCSALGTLGDVLFLDLSQYLLIKKGDIQKASSIHVRFLAGENTFRCMQRWNGQGIWNSAITPYKGSNTVSPFIALETRA